VSGWGVKCMDVWQVCVGRHACSASNCCCKLAQHSPGCCGCGCGCTSASCASALSALSVSSASSAACCCGGGEGGGGGEVGGRMATPWRGKDGTCCTFSARRSVKLRLHDDALVLAAGSASAPLAGIRLSESASFSFGFLEIWCCGLDRRSHACVLLPLLLLLMLHRLLGFMAWRERGGREMLVFWCVHAR
jgi:hypothetical protein